NLLSGPTAIAFTEEDPVRLAKVLVDFAKENKILEIKGGLLKGEFVEENRVKEIANLPPREELLAKFAYFMAFPLTKMLRLFQSPLSNFGLLVSQLKDKK
ncbi:MAG: 50S ribosomal protein L10, partial [Candidatus Aminicenantia bacterium]